VQGQPANALQVVRLQSAVSLQTPHFRTGARRIDASAGFGYRRRATAATLQARQRPARMLKLYDYLPSRNAWKVRQLLHHLGLPYQAIPVSIFEGEGRQPAFLRVNPSGKVPALELEDGRTLAESNAILAYLADGSDYLPADRYLRAKVHQWLSFEQEQVEMSIGSLRYWTLTGKLPHRDATLVAGKRKAALRTLALLDDELATRLFIVDGRYSIADISIFAYASRAEDAGLSLAAYPHFRAWLERVQSQQSFLPEVHPYSIDPHSGNELP